MISTKKQLHLLGENPRHSNLSLTNQTFVCCVNIIYYKLDKQKELLSSNIGLITLIKTPQFQITI